jgi:hypothetical protein
MAPLSGAISAAAICRSAILEAAQCKSPRLSMFNHRSRRPRLPPVKAQGTGDGRLEQ